MYVMCNETVFLHMQYVVQSGELVWNSLQIACCGQRFNDWFRRFDH